MDVKKTSGVLDATDNKHTEGVTLDEGNARVPIVLLSVAYNATSHDTLQFKHSFVLLNNFSTITDINHKRLKQKLRLSSLWPINV